MSTSSSGPSTAPWAVNTLSLKSFTVKSAVQLLSHVLLFVTPWTVAIWALLSVGFPSKNTGVGYYFLLQGIFPTQGSSPRLLQCSRLGLDTWVGKMPWRRAWQPTPVFLLRQSHGQRSSVGYSLLKESDMTEQLKTLSDWPNC